MYKLELRRYERSILRNFGQNLLQGVLLLIKFLQFVSGMIAITCKKICVINFSPQLSRDFRVITPFRVSQNWLINSSVCDVGEIFTLACLMFYTDLFTIRVYRVNIYLNYCRILFDMMMMMAISNEINHMNLRSFNQLFFKNRCPVNSMFLIYNVVLANGQNVYFFFVSSPQLDCHFLSVWNNR